jgi:hypothetical protein
MGCSACGGGARWAALHLCQRGGTAAAQGRGEGSGRAGRGEEGEDEGQGAEETGEW